MNKSDDNAQLTQNGESEEQLLSEESSEAPDANLRGKCSLDRMQVLEL